MEWHETVSAIVAVSCFPPRPFGVLPDGRFACVGEIPLGRFHKEAVADGRVCHPHVASPASDHDMHAFVWWHPCAIARNPADHWTLFRCFALVGLLVLHRHQGRALRDQL